MNELCTEGVAYFEGGIGGGGGGEGGWRSHHT